MKTFESLTIKQVKKEIIAWETEMGRVPKSVEIISVGQHSTADDIDANIYTDDNGDTMEYFFARVIIDGEEKTRYYVWNLADEDIYTGMDEDPQDWEDNENDDAQLPPNIVERCMYVGQSLDTLDLSEANVDVTKELAVPVTFIRMDYPFLVERGDFNVYKIPEAKTWGELLTETIKVFQREYNADKKVQAMHTLEDYIIEPITIHPNNLATVCIGS